MDVRQGLAIVVALALLVSTLGQSKITGGKITGGKLSVSGIAPFVSDTFTETGETLLADHIGEIGADWTVHPSYTPLASINFDTDRLYTTGDPEAYYASGTPPSANYSVCTDIHAVSNISVNIGPCGRMDTTANTMYCFRYNGGTIWQLRLVNAGAQSTIDSSTNQLITVGSSKRACLVMNGDTISGTVEGVEEVSVTDTVISAAGKAGFRAAGGMSSTTGYHLDNFVAQ